MAAESRECRSVAYSRRHLEQTVLYLVVQQHLEIDLLLANEGNSTMGNCASASCPSSVRPISPQFKPASAGACCAGSSAVDG